MPTAAAPPTLTPSSNSSKLTALISAPAPKESTSPISRFGHGRRRPSSIPSTSDDAASAPQPNAAPMEPILTDLAVAHRRAEAGGSAREAQKPCIPPCFPQFGVLSLGYGNSNDNERGGAVNDDCRHVDLHDRHTAEHRPERLQGRGDGRRHRQGRRGDERNRRQLRRRRHG